jgi:secreted Zn-dependent insulinase-like peptidase
MDATVYQFEVQSEFLAGALDIFAQFFVAPLFSESATEREMRAVSHSLHTNFNTLKFTIVYISGSTQSVVFQ